MKNIKIVITFLFLWLSIQIDGQVENIIAYLAIFTLGLLHGANDIQLLTKRLKPKNGAIGSILWRYVSFVVIVGILFYVLPTLALAAFVIISGFHFGEEHWEKKVHGHRWIKNLFFTSYGLLILFLIFYLNYAETSLIIKTITQVIIPPNYFLIGISVLAVLTGLILILLWKGFNKPYFLIEETLYLLVFYIVFSMANLLLSFAIYFVIWHAVPSLKRQIDFLYGKTSRQTVLKYIQSSLLYWSVSIIAVLLFYYFLGDQPYLFNAIFFAFLAAITFPHVWVINSLNT